MTDDPSDDVAAITDPEHPTTITRHGVRFELLIEPSGATWLEVTGQDGDLLALERVPPGTVEPATVSDRWIADRLAEIPATRRCVQCGLPVVAAGGRLIRRPRPNVAVEYRIWTELAVESADDDEVQYMRLRICVPCRDDLIRHHPWLEELLPLPEPRRRAR